MQNTEEKKAKYCFDCSKYETCEYAVEDGTACNNYEEVRYCLTPKGVWFGCCIEEFSDDGKDMCVDMDLCIRFFEKFMHNMYACGLIEEKHRTKIGLVIRFWLKDIKRLFNGQKKMNSLDVILETGKDDEFAGTDFADAEVLIRLHKKFHDGMKIHGYLG